MLTLKYLDTCLPDYFQGFGGETFAVPLHSGMTHAEVLAGLNSEISGWSGYFAGEQAAEKDFADLHKSAADMFAHADSAKAWDEHAGDECYAYFGVQGELRPDVSPILATLDNFTRAYIRTALWASYDNSRAEGFNDDTTLDKNFAPEDIAPTALHSIIEDCKQFQEKHADLLARAYELYSFHPDAPTGEHSAGHDFFLTRNRHGVGFWDRKELEADGIGEQLTEAAHAAGTVDFYIGDDGLIYV